MPEHPEHPASDDGVRVTLTLTLDVPLSLAVEGLTYVGTLVPLAEPGRPAFHVRVLDSTVTVPPGTAPTSNDMTESDLARAWQPATPTD